MKKLIYYYGDSPVNVEGFSEDCKRSRKGALHLLKGRPITITDDEFAHIEKVYKWAMPKIRVVAQIKDKTAKVDKAEVKKEVTTKEAVIDKPVKPKEDIAKPEKEKAFDDGKKLGFGKKKTK